MMETSNQERKALAISGIAENFGTELSPTLLRMWLRLLERYTPEQVEIGAVRVIDTYVYKAMPPFAVLREAIEGMSCDGQRQKEIGLQANAEWAWLMDQVSKGLLYRQPERVHPTTAYVIRMMGGWAAVGAWEQRYLDFKRRDFLELWTQAHGKVDALKGGASAVLALIESHRLGACAKLEKALGA